MDKVIKTRKIYRVSLFNLIIVITLLISSCGNNSSNSIKGSDGVEISEKNGVKIYKNGSKGSNPNERIELKELFRITGDLDNVDELDSARYFGSASDMDFDSKGNLYILDMPRGQVKKFDGDGNFIKSFGKRGTGPGEFVLANALAVINDTIFVADINARKFSKFNPDGEFIGFNNVAGVMPQYLFSIGGENFISLVNRYQRVDEDMYLSFFLGLFDTKFDSVYAFKGGYRQKLDRNRSFNLLDFNVPYTWSQKNREIFVAKNSEDRYQVDVYDYTGKHKSTITKKYRKTKFNDGELDEFNRWSQQFYPPTTATYKKAINTMYFDKYDRLWVAKSVDRDDSNREDFILDIFKYGEYLNTVTLDICKGYDYYNEGYQLFFQNEKIYLLDMINAEIVVYEY